MHSRLTLLLGLATLATSACSPPRVTEASPRIEVQPLALDFGPVPAGLPSSLTLRLRNTGNAALVVSSVAVDDGAFSSVAPGTAIEPGDSLALEVRFTPPAEGEFDGVLTISSDAADNPEQRVTLHGVGVPRVACVDCNSPPPSFCTGAGQSVQYALTGSCVGGRCEYEAHTSACPAGCTRGVCLGADAGAADAGEADAGVTDAGVTDAGEADAGVTDAGVTDAGVPDAGVEDAGVADAGVPDAGPVCAAGLDLRVDLNQNLVPDCAETLVANGQLLGNIAPWAAVVTPPNTATVTWSSVDELTAPGSGSLSVTNTSAVTSANGASIVGECISLVPNANYGTYVRYFMASGQPGGNAAARVWVTYDAYADDACAVPVAAISGGALGTTKDAWATYSRQLSTADAGFGEYRSVRLHLGVLKGATTSAVSAQFDNVLLVRE